eukprot:CAMPEP_0118962516 /NCGR_PEP_ID=MMETSP1173-20130426/827_1 /TAXON_ID=1034831 /ORGANISM="Rhizochromulina marina cf, Strain CCMP1243" /LENGTH=85 /DNA_ID=CAMNT_0006910791 /DNA_START=100 /DNA_END=357 /DNA_ORIENTATION=+
MSTFAPTNAGLNIQECLALSKTQSHDQLPSACQRYLDHVAVQSKAWEGASFKDRVTGTKAAASGRPSHVKLQRRMTNPRVSNPYK